MAFFSEKRALFGAKIRCGTQKNVVPAKKMLEQPFFALLGYNGIHTQLHNFTMWRLHLLVEATTGLQGFTNSRSTTQLYCAGWAVAESARRPPSADTAHFFTKKVSNTVQTGGTPPVFDRQIDGVTY